MSTSKHIDKICLVIVVFTLLLGLAVPAGTLAEEGAPEQPAYAARLFEGAAVHTIDIVMDDWDAFLDSCENEEYALCAVVIDGEVFRNVGIRAKGNTSLSSVAAMGSDRYSFKLEFDHYVDGKTCYGLDKLCLNNLIQDATFMKDYLVYRLMDSFGVDAPLCSYAFLTVNGEDWGLYLAVEGVEESFLRRNYGENYGALYKPDSSGLGGGRGNGRGFAGDEAFGPAGEGPGAGRPGGFGRGEELPGAPGPDGLSGELPGGQEFPGGQNAGGPPEDARPEGIPDFGTDPAQGGPAAPGPGETPGGLNSSDLKLQYIDDDPASYPNIFDNAKTAVTAADQARLIRALQRISAGEEIETAVNVEEVLRYFVVHNLVCNGDSYTGSMVHNYYLYEEDGRLSMIPWDYNLAFGTFHAGDASAAVNFPIDTPVSDGEPADRPMLNWIFTDERYTALYHQYLEEFLAGTDLDALIRETAALIAPYVERDPTKFYSVEEFERGTAALRDFCRLRARSVRGQLEGSIPATAEGQRQAGAALIDTSGLTLSEMGSMAGMGNMGNMGAGGRSPGGQPPGGIGMPGAP